MNRRTIAFALPALLVAAPAAAQAPPIQPGLWQVEKYETDRPAAGPASGPAVAERLRNMPPERRQRMEALMKERGIDMSGMGAGGPAGMKMCYDRESLDQGRWQGDQGRCQVDFTSRTARSWKWKSTCTQPPSQGEGEAVFDGTDRYTVSFSSTVAIAGQPRTSRHTMTMKRLGADCGGLKPIQAMRPPRP